MIKIPHYKIERELGVGGMSTVYLATHQILDRKVALKVMSPSFLLDGTFKDCFINEGRIISKLDNPHIIHIYDIGISNDACYMAIELLEGDTLRDKINNNDLSIPDIQKVITQISSALNTAHSQNFIHRDIKPGNTLFRQNNDAVLTDFGISKVQDTDGELTTLGFTAGTPSYMPPEFSMGEELDHRADIYSLGVVFYEMLTGEKPFKGKTAAAISYEHVHAPVPLLEPKFAHFQAVINKVLAKEAHNRFSSVLDFSKAVEQANISSASTIISNRVTSSKPIPSPEPVEDPTNINLIKPKKSWGIYLGVIFLFSLIPVIFFVMPEKGMDIVRKLGLVSDTPETIIDEPIDKLKGQPNGNGKPRVVDPATGKEQATGLGVDVIPKNTPVLENENKLTQEQEQAVYGLLGNSLLRTSFIAPEMLQNITREELIEKGGFDELKIRSEIETSKESIKFHADLYHEHLLALKEYNVDLVLELFEAYKPIPMPASQQSKYEIYYVIRKHISESANSDITLLKLKEDLKENTRLRLEESRENQKKRSGH